MLDKISKRITFGTNNNVNIFNIVFGVDTNYICHTGICMTSIATNNPNLNLEFHIITDKIDEVDLIRLKNFSGQYNLKINIYYVNESAFENYPTFSYFPRAMYFRLIAPSLIKSNRLLYLDADMICVGDLSPLWEIDLNDKIAAVVPDIAITQNSQKKVLNLTTTYFNSGFLYINIENWHKFKISENLLSFFNTNTINLSFPDQDALNIVLKNKVIFIDKKWNFFKIKDSTNNEPVIFHFVNSPKPWQIWCNYQENEYLYYKNISFWSEVSLEKPTNFRKKRIYAQILFRQGKLIKASIWLIRYNKFRKLK